MKSLFNETEFQEIQQRVASLTPANVRKWGKMDIAQMMAHCSVGFEKATGKLPFEDKSNFIMRTLVKKIVLHAVKKGDLGKNQKTFPDYAITDNRDFETEKKRLLDGLRAFYQLRTGNGPGRHPYFGKF